MQFYQIVNKINKKGGMGLTDFFSILTFALIIIIFYLFARFTLGSTTFELSAESSNTENSISLINILRTSVIVDNVEMSISELIALANFDSAKYVLLERMLKQIMDNSYGISSCNIICIDRNKIKGNGCSNFQTYICSSNVITIPSYNGKSIEISFENNIRPIGLVPVN